MTLFRQGDATLSNRSSQGAPIEMPYSTHTVAIQSDLVSVWLLYGKCMGVPWLLLGSTLATAWYHLGITCTYTYDLKISQKKTRCFTLSNILHIM